MKHKSPKRSLPTKDHQHRRLSISSTAIDGSAISSKQVDLGTGTVHLNSHRYCLKANVTLKSQKVLKRDLLRCGDQRPSLLGPQTLQPPRLHQGSHHSHSNDRQPPVRRRSLSTNSRTLYATIDRIGPWPDISISRLRSDGNELLRPLKNFRNVKNPRVFSPKYYTALNDNTSKFKFYSSTRNYIEEYRKQKGYLLNPRTTTQSTSVSIIASVPIQQTEEEQLSIAGEFNSGLADRHNGTARDRSVLSPTNFSLAANRSHKSVNNVPERINNTPASIPSGTKVFSEPPHIHNFPTATMRNGHLRSTRHPPHHAAIAQQSQHQQAIALPSLMASSLHYISSMTSVEKAYSNSKKPPVYNQSRFFLIDGRHKKRRAPRIHSDSEVSSRSHNYSELRATGGPIGTTVDRTTAVVLYQLPRRPPPMAVSQSDVGTLS